MSELDLSPTSLQAEEDGKGLVSTAVSSLGNGWESPSHDEELLKILQPTA